MEEVPGIPSLLPPMVKFPPRTVRHEIPSAEWQLCLDAWCIAVEVRLRLSQENFHRFTFSLNASGFPFLLSYFQEAAYLPGTDHVYRPHGLKAVKLHRQVLLLTRRLLLQTDPPHDCQTSDFLALVADGSAVFAGSAVWKDTLRLSWNRDQAQWLAAVDLCKKALVDELTVTQRRQTAVLRAVRQAVAITRACPGTGVLFMTGSDFLEAMVTSYDGGQLPEKDRTVQDLEKELTALIFYCLRSLMESLPPLESLLLDHLFVLKTSADKKSNLHRSHPTLLSGLLCSTSFLRYLDIFLSRSEQKRGLGLLTFLKDYRQQTTHLHDLSVTDRVRGRKGRAKAIVPATRDIHMRTASQVSQISQLLELFPGLSISYISRLLDHFSGDLEAVTAALLEPESLPHALQDRGPPDGPDTHFDLLPHATPPLLPERRNVFDGDVFDHLRIPSEKVHIGRMDLAKAPANLNEHTTSKPAIMAALGAFDSDDDERDDTYDVADVGGTVDSTLDTESRPQIQVRPAGPVDINEEQLFKAWKSEPAIFARDTKTRMSQSRQQLKHATGMGDEQIEGWALMLAQDRSAVNKLERKYIAEAAYGGKQRTLIGTRWSASRSGTGTEDDDTDEAGANGLNASREGLRRGRAGGFGRRGSTAGPTDAKSTQAARQRKEQGRGRGGASHNRREGRSKKMGRGMAGLPVG